MKKVILNTVAALLTVLGLGGIATISPAYAVVFCADGTEVKDIALCNEWSGNSGISQNNDLMATLTTVINVIVGAIGWVILVRWRRLGIRFSTGWLVWSWRCWRLRL